MSIKIGKSDIVQNDNIILSLNKITKSYPGVLALDNVSMDFRQGEVHALLGENGAGKSTLIKVISGAIEPDSGTISIKGKTFSKITPHLSKAQGIEVIYQEFNLIPALSSAENIFLGEPLRKGVLADKKAMSQKAAELFKSFNIDINPDIPVRNLSTAYQQIVEIARAVSKNASILIMDEPSAPLTTSEVGILFDIIRKLREKGVTIIYISHRMEEVFEISDRVTVMRDGKYITTKFTQETERKELISLMVGRELTETYPARTKEPGPTVLEVKKLCGNGIKDISFSVRKGEILGLAGLVGSGRTELVRTVFGAEPAESGEILLEGKSVRIKSPKDAIKMGIGLIPEDRKRQGVFLELDVKTNISLAAIKDLCKFSLVDKRAENMLTSDYKEQLKIKTPGLKQKVKNLSGGNQQKVVLAKWLATKTKILIFDEPSRGIDVGAKQEIYNLMRGLTDNGMTIIMISSDMEELLGMSDRIIVLCEGKVAGEVSKSEFSQNYILELASGNR